MQGVGFRYYTQQQAELIGVTGYVENRADGSVNIHVEGSDEELSQFLSWCHKGPKSADVERLEYCHVEHEGYKNFRIKR